MTDAAGRMKYYSQRYQSGWVRACSCTLCVGLYHTTLVRSIAGEKVSTSLYIAGDRVHIKQAESFEKYSIAICSHFLNS